MPENTKPIITERISHLDNLRAIAIIMVVAGHTFGYCRELPQLQDQILSFIIVQIPVPAFILVDGYLFARSVINLRSYNYWKHIGSSLVRLLVPWMIFTIIYTLARYVSELYGFLDERLILGHSWLEIAASAYGSVYATQLWFLPALFFIRLSIPVIKPLFVAYSRRMMVLSFLLYYISYKLIIPYISPYLEIAGGQEPILHSLWGLQFYILGIVIYRFSEILDLRKLFVPFLILFFFGTLAQFKLGLIGTDIVQYLYLISFYLLFTVYKNRHPLLNYIGRNTMGIYLLHVPIIIKVVSIILNRFITIPMLSFLSVFFFTLVITGIIVNLINSIPHGHILFGMKNQENYPARFARVQDVS